MTTTLREVTADMLMTLTRASILVVFVCECRVIQPADDASDMTSRSSVYPRHLEPMWQSSGDESSELEVRDRAVAEPSLRATKGIAESGPRLCQGQHLLDEYNASGSYGDGGASSSGEEDEEIMNETENEETVEHSKEAEERVVDLEECEETVGDSEVEHVETVDEGTVDYREGGGKEAIEAILMHEESSLECDPHADMTLDPVDVNYDTNTLEEMADAHEREVEEKFTCDVPRPEVICLDKISSHLTKRYIPKCTVVFRCRETSGCCVDGERCHVIEWTAIERAFREFDLLSNDINSIRLFHFVNHTKCSCMGRLSISG